MSKESFHTICAREVPDPRTTSPHILPLYLSSSFDFENIDQGMRIFRKEEKGHVYGRYDNPTVEAVESKIAALEGLGQEVESSALLFSSGMAAIYTLLITLLEPGDFILTEANLYGGTTELFQKVIKKHGIRIHFTDFNDPAAIDQSLSSLSKNGVIYCETPANPTHACVDIQALSENAHSAGLPLIVDNTFSTPYLQQPFQFGADYIIHSTTKYLNGHGTGIGGAVVGREMEKMKKSLWEMRKLTGTTLSPFEAWLVHNGMKTLALRMEKHSSNGLAIARFLDYHSAVGKVNYCGLAHHPSHAIARKQMRNYGGIISFELKGGMDAGIQFMRKIKHCALAPTLGDVDTLVLHPASMSHINIERSLREKYGITDGLIRLSVGIEDAHDIIADLDQALS